MAPYITASVKGRNINEAIEKITNASILPYVDLIEIRFDYFKDHSSIDLKELFSSSKKPLIFTNMPDWEGGNFKGSEKDRINYIKNAIELKVPYYHIELRAVRKKPEILEELKSQNSKAILSYHDFRKVPNTIEDILLELSSKKTFLNKIAVRPNSEKETERIKNLHRINNSNKIIIGMGKIGKATRMDKRNYLTFGPLEKEEATAPGQLTVEEIARELGRI